MARARAKTIQPLNLDLALVVQISEKRQEVLVEATNNEG